MENKQHILLASYPAQGHINPTLSLAKLLARRTAARITFSTAVSAHRRMFPNQQTAILDDDLFAYTPFSNGYDDGFHPKTLDKDFFSHTNNQSSITLAAILDNEAARGRPVTCIIYSFIMSWAANIARERGIPSFLFWIQPATAFAAYWHHFHDTDPLSAVNLPQSPTMTIRDLPSFITDHSDDFYATIFTQIRSMFDTLDVEISMHGSKPRVLANTSDAMEAPAISSVADAVSIVAIGPLLEETTEGSMLKTDGKNEYMDWLDRQVERSVVYVSFGSISVLRKEQIATIRRGLRASGRPYLWVVRKDNRLEGVDVEEDDEKKGMVVEWCSQGRVLGHKAVGCFVTHCGWNSTVESLLHGVPTVAVPQWTDQLTNAWLMEKEWGTGVRVEDGLVEADELRRCIEIVMGEGEIRRKAEIWKKNACETTIEGGSSYDNLEAFVKDILG